MALFEKKICAHCGKEIGVLERIKLKDGKYICFDCSEKCTRLIRDKFLQYMTYADFADYMTFRASNKTRLEQFNITDTYFDKIHVDMEKGWFVFDSKKKIKDKETLLEAQPDIFEAKDLVYCKFFYIVKDVKQGVFHDKIKADVRLVIAFNSRWYPYAFNDKVLANYKHQAEITGFFTHKATITDNEKKSDLELYLLSILIDNRVMIPANLGGKLTMDFDFSPYDTYLTKLFELKKHGVYESEEMDEILKHITPSMALRHKLNKLYGKK